MQKKIGSFFLPHSVEYGRLETIMLVITVYTAECGMYSKQLQQNVADYWNQQ